MSEHDEVPTFSLGRGDAMRWMMAMRAGADLMRTVRESRGRAAFEDAENVARIEAVAAENGLRKLSADDTEQWNAAAAAGRVYAEQHPESGMTVRIAPLSGGRYGVQAGWEDNYTSTVVGSAKMAGELRSWLHENSNYSSIDDLRGTVEELHQHQLNLAAQTAQERATFEREESRRVEIARWLHQPEQARVRAMWENTSHPEFRGENGFEESRRKFWLNGVFQHAQKHNGDLAKATEWALEHDKEFYGDWRKNARRVNFQNFEEPEMRDAERNHELALIGRWASAFAADKEFEAAQAWASEHDPALYQNWQRAQAQATGLDETRRGRKTFIDAVSVSKELSAAKAWMKKAGNEQVALDWEFPDAHTWQGEDGVQAQWLRGQWHASEAYTEGLSEAEQIEEANAWMALPRNEKIAAEFDEPSTQTWEDFREEWLRGRWRDAQAEAAQAAQDAPPPLTLADRLEGRVDQSILGDKKWATAERQFTALVRDGADPDRLADVVAGITFNEKIRSPSGYASWQMRRRQRPVGSRRRARTKPNARSQRNGSRRRNPAIHSIGRGQRCSWVRSTNRSTPNSPDTIRGCSTETVCASKRTPRQRATTETLTPPKAKRSASSTPKQTNAGETGPGRPTPPPTTIPSCPATGMGKSSISTRPTAGGTRTSRCPMNRNLTSRSTTTTSGRREAPGSRSRRRRARSRSGSFRSTRSVTAAPLPMPARNGRTRPGSEALRERNGRKAKLRRCSPPRLRPGLLAR